MQDTILSFFESLNLNLMPGVLFLIPVLAIIIALGFLNLGKMIQDRLPGKKCQICQKIKSDVLSQGKQRWYLCRQHLLSKYSDLFLKNSYKAVIVEFASDFRHTRFKNDILYPFYPVSDPNFKNAFMDTLEVLKQLLETINSHKCRECSSKAYILFINKEDAVWKKIRTRKFEDYDFIIPSKEYLSKGLYLCNEHALTRIRTSLLDFPKPITYDGGVWLPYKEDGFQTPA